MSIALILEVLSDDDARVDLPEDAEAEVGDCEREADIISNHANSSIFAPILKILIHVAGITQLHAPYDGHGRLSDEP